MLISSYQFILAVSLLMAAAPSSTAVAQSISTPGDSIVEAPALLKGYKKQLVFPAQALSYSTFNNAFVASIRGMDWVDPTGYATLTIQRPKNYTDGGNVRITAFYQVLDDSGGTQAITVTPVNLRSGGSFETYGGVAGEAIDVPESPTALVAQSVTIGSGLGFRQSGDWWYFEIGRNGTFVGRVRLMSLTVEY